MSSVHNHPAGPGNHHASHGSVKSYVIGFALSLVLTILSFWAVKSGVVPHGEILPAIVVLAVVQLLVQLVFFLHMGTGPDKGENLGVFVFTLLIIAIMVAGTVWVMHNMNANMMPMHTMSALQAG
jgi:cytochrome o ubiquinol oxidase operon protein cyoD